MPTTELNDEIDRWLHVYANPKQYLPKINDYAAIEKKTRGIKAEAREAIQRLIVEARKNELDIAWDEWHDNKEMFNTGKWFAVRGVELSNSLNQNKINDYDALKIPKEYLEGLETLKENK